MSTDSTTDRIPYEQPFADNVGGQLVARFRLDADGKPEFEEDDDGLRHYFIDLSLVSPRNSSIEVVEYRMDDPTFAGDPIAVSNDRPNNFRELIQSYGDVPIDVTVQVEHGRYRQRAWLSQMLENGHPNPSSAIRSALRRIKVN